MLVFSQVAISFLFEGWTSFWFSIVFLFCFSILLLLRRNNYKFRMKSPNQIIGSSLPATFFFQLSNKTVSRVTWFLSLGGKGRQKRPSTASQGETLMVGRILGTWLFAQHHLPAAISDTGNGSFLCQRRAAPGKMSSTCYIQWCGLEPK